MELNYHSEFQWKHQWTIALIVLNLPLTHANLFPDVEDLSKLKPISSSSTCGETASKYCKSSDRESSLNICSEETCKFDCCADCGSKKPSPSNLVNPANIHNIQRDESRPNSSDRSYGFHGNSYIQPLRVPSIDYVNKGFTISVWIKQTAGNRG